MAKRQYIYSSYNRYFLLPFFLWVVIGGILLLIFDRRTLFETVNGHYNPFLDFVMYYSTWMGEGTVITVALLLLLFIVPAFRNWWYFITALLCNLLPSFLQQWLKHMFNAPRPLNYYHEQGWIHVGAGWDRLFNHSFPSGHTTGAFSMFCFLSFLLPAQYKKWGLLFFCLSLLVAYSRLYLAAHFFADVYAGSIVGTVTTVIIFSVMKRYQPYFFKKNDRLTATNS